MSNEPEDCRQLTSRLRQGVDIAEPAFLHGSLAFSDYAFAFMRNAQELLSKSGWPDFALPGGLYMIRHGLELWLKCILVNRSVDRLLRRITTSTESFESLAADASLIGATPKRLRAESGISLKAALCAMRNVLVDGLGHPDCRQVRQDVGDANDALTFLRQNADTPRNRVAVLWMPPIEGHRLLDLWGEAEPCVSDLRLGAEEELAAVGGGPLMRVSDLKSVYMLFNHLDPYGDALRYPASLGGNWHLVSPRWSLGETSALASELAETIQLYQGYRAIAYDHATVGNPDGGLYLGGR